MSEQELYNKTDEIISKFKNGKEKYRQSALFNRVVQMLVRDADPFEIIETLIDNTENTNEAFKQFMYRCSCPKSFPKP